MSKLKLRNSYRSGLSGRFKRRLLTLEEVNERVHYYHPNLDVLTYRGCAYSATIRCNDCGRTYDSSGGIRAYMYGYAVACEKCRRDMLLDNYRYLIRNSTLDVYDFYSENGSTYIKARCSVCGEKDVILLSTLYSGRGCLKCKKDAQIKEYKELLSKYNCTFIDTFNKSTGPYIKFYCNICHREDTIAAAHLICGNNYCKICNPNSKLNLSIQYNLRKINEGKGTGKYIEISDKYRMYSTHLLCGNTLSILKKSPLGSDLCNSCKGIQRKICNTVEDNSVILNCITILENVKLLKDILEEHDQIKELPEGEVKMYLEHVDGWLNNLKNVVKEYSNETLVETLSKNPLYKRCEELFYPIMDKFGIERKQ